MGGGEKRGKGFLLVHNYFFKCNESNHLTHQRGDIRRRTYPLRRVETLDVKLVVEMLNPLKEHPAQFLVGGMTLKVCLKVFDDLTDRCLVLQPEESQQKQTSVWP